MTIPKINFDKVYKQDEHQRAFQSIADSINARTNQIYDVAAGCFYAANQTGQGWGNFYSGYNTNTIFNGWIAPRPGSVISVSVYNYMGGLGQQYGIAINNVPPKQLITVQKNTTNTFQNYPTGLITFKAGDLVMLWVRNTTSTATNYGCIGHYAVQIGS